MNLDTRINFSLVWNSNATVDSIIYLFNTLFSFFDHSDYFVISYDLFTNQNYFTSY